MHYRLGKCEGKRGLFCSLSVLIKLFKMKHGSFFNGVGGFQLAAEWMGWENVMSCEINKLLNQVTKYYWPDCTQHEDIRDTDFTIYRNKIDILTGGFPCQPYSLAGKRKGKEDDRHLWPEMLRGIREIQPTYVVGENVFGLVNWSGGLVFHEVQADLEAQGYEVFPFILPACAVGAPHRRDRIWFVAHAIGRTARPSRTSGRTDSNRGAINPQPQEWRGEAELNTGCDTILRNATDTKSIRRGKKKANVSEREMAEFESHHGAEIWDRTSSDNTNVTDTTNTRTESLRERKNSIHGFENVTDTNGIGLRGESNGFGKSRFVGETNTPNDWQNFPTQSPVCGGDDGLPSQLDGITFSKWRQESIKAYGNAIVPQVALEIFKAINKTLV